MKTTPIAVLLTLLVLSACAPAVDPTAAPNPPAAPTPQAEATSTSLPTTGLSADETQQATQVVQGFGAKLQVVSLLSPTAAADIQAQYAGFVDPTLLQQWAADPSTAPGRVTSSPWPDRIEITSMDKTSPDQIDVKGNIIEVTSVEVNTGTAAATIPVEIGLQKNAQGKWWITTWKQQQ